MPLTKCTECGGVVSTTAWMCPHCGARSRRNNLPLVVLAIVVVALLAAASFFLIAGGNP
jgi:hypothetical protein